jgi:hypothetical protein
MLPKTPRGTGEHSFYRQSFQPFGQFYWITFGPTLTESGLCLIPNAVSFPCHTGFQNRVNERFDNFFNHLTWGPNGTSH